MNKTKIIAFIGFTFVITAAFLGRAIYSLKSEDAQPPVSSVDQDLLVKIKQDNKDSVLFLVTPNTEGGSVTGFRVKAKSGRVVIMTANHVCNNALGYGYLLASKDSPVRLANAYVLEQEPKNDLCIMSEAISGPQVTTIGPEPKFADPIESYGHPLKGTLTETEGQIQLPTPTFHSFLFFGDNAFCARMSGIISVSGVTQAAMCELSMPGILVATTMPVALGDSGSPVFNAMGGLIGVISQMNTQSGMGYIVPYAAIADLLGLY